MSSLIDTSHLDPADLIALSAAKAVPSAIPTRQRTRIINQIATEVLLQSYTDRILILVTQLGRIGSFIQISPPHPTSSPLPPHPTTTTTSTNTTSLFPHLPTLNPNLTLTTLFGVAPDERRSRMYDLFGMMIGSIVYSPETLAAATRRILGEEEEGERKRNGSGGDGGEEGKAERERGGGEDFGREERRPIVLGIALKGLKTTEAEVEGGEEGVAKEERQVFGEVMEMVLECWQGLR